MKEGSTHAVSVKTPPPQKKKTQTQRIQKHMQSDNCKIKTWTFGCDQKTQTLKQRLHFASAGFYTNLNSNAKPHALFFGKDLST